MASAFQPKKTSDDYNANQTGWYRPDKQLQTLQILYTIAATKEELLASTFLSQGLHTHVPRH